MTQELPAKVKTIYERLKTEPVTKAYVLDDKTDLRPNRKIEELLHITPTVLTEPERHTPIQRGQNISKPRRKISKPAQYTKAESAIMPFVRYARLMLDDDSMEKVIQSCIWEALEKDASLDTKSIDEIVEAILPHFRKSFQAGARNDESFVKAATATDGSNSCFWR